MDVVTAVVILLAVGAVCLTAVICTLVVVGYLRDRHGVMSARLTNARS